MERASMYLNKANDKVKSKLKCCKGVGKKYLYFMNGFIMFIGVVLLAISIFNAVRSGDIADGLGQAGIVGPIIAGSLLIVNAGIGFVGLCYKSKFLLILYFLINLVMTVFIMGAGVLLLFFVKDLNNIDGENSENFVGRVESQINDFIIAIFNECCAKPFNLDRLLGCDDPLAGPACFTFIDQYQAALVRVQTSGLCDTLENIDFNGFPVVGDPAIPGQEGSCAGGNGQVFKAVFTGLVEDQLRPIGGVFFGLGLILFLTLIASCSVLCANQDEYMKKDEGAPRYEFDEKPYNNYNYGNNNYGNNNYSNNLPPGMLDNSLPSKMLANGTSNPKYRTYSDY